MTKPYCLIAITALMLGLGACADNDGPFEELGESMDNAADDVRDGVEEACEEMADSMGAKDPDCG